jgi:hypothetical protein
MEYQSPLIIIEIGKYLRSPMPLAQEDLEGHMIGLEALRYELAQATVDQLQLLYQKKKQMLWPKDAEKGMTELDRNTRLNADVSIIDRDYQFLLRLEPLVEFRLQMAMMFLD